MLLCCGEALIDMIPEPAGSGREGFVPHPGGAVFNTAIALGRLGAPSAMLTGLSTDMFGRQLRAALQKSGVDTDLVVESARPTTLAFVQLEGGQASYSFFDENSAGRMLTPQDMPPLPEAAQALFFGGISLACEPCADAYARLLEREGDGRTVMIDPNIRPGFIASAEAYRSRLDGMLRRADVVKVSGEDLDWMIPGPASARDKIGALIAKGPSVAILTLGAEGATGFGPDGAEIHVPAAPVEVADTVGAGDTFNAGFLAMLWELGLLGGGLAGLAQDALEAAMRHGAKAAAVTVSRNGADPPYADEL